MNIICAFLLLVLTEEEAFWMMCMLCEHTLKNYYTHEMLGSVVDQRVFDLLLAETLPHVHTHITQTLEIPIAWFTLPWFLCLFIGKLPLTVGVPGPLSPPPPRSQWGAWVSLMLYVAFRLYCKCSIASSIRE